MNGPKEFVRLFTHEVQWAASLFQDVKQIINNKLTQGGWGGMKKVCASDNGTDL